MNERNFYYIGIAFFGMINGMFNPAFFFVFQLFANLMAGAAVRQYRSHRLCSPR